MRGTPEYFAFAPVRQRLVGHALSEASSDRPIVPQGGPWRSNVLGLEIAVERGSLRFHTDTAPLPDARELIDRLSSMVDGAVGRAEEKPAARRSELTAPSACSKSARARRGSRRDRVAPRPGSGVALKRWVMQPWERLGRATAPDGQPLELMRRGHEWRIRAGGHELMSSEDEPSSRSLAELGCAHVEPSAEARVLVGGLGMGFTLRETLDRIGPRGVVEIAELVPEVVAWNEGPLGPLADRPLEDPRVEVHVGDVRARIRAGRERYDAILLDVDNGPIRVAHAANDALYADRGITEAWAALKPGGVLGVWSLEDDARYTKRLERRGFRVKVHRVFGSRKGRGREHVIWIARRPPPGR